MAAQRTPLIYEEHCSVLADWVERGFQGKTLVYVDAHLDLQFIRDERMQRLAAAKTRSEIDALEKTGHLLPDGDFVYGIENFLYAAARLGVVDRLIWVSPPHVDIRLSPEVLDYVQQIDGVTFEELTGIRQTADSCYEATLLGLDITFCNIGGLERLSIPEGSLVDIDTDFFVALPSDRAWMDPRELHAAIAACVPKPEMISIARSVGSGFMPLRYRYFADYLAALFTAEAEPATHYAKLFDIEHGNDDEAACVAAIEDESRAFPDCAATLYLRDRLIGVAELHAAAGSICGAYSYDPVRLASAVVNRHLATDKSQIDNLRAALGAAAEAEAPVALGLAYAARGAVHEALECYREYGQPHPQLALEIAGLLAVHGDTGQRRALLEVAATEDACMSSALLQLADIAISEGDLGEARRLTEKVQSMAPAWMEPLGRLAWLYEQESPDSGPNPYRDEFEARSAALRRLLAV
jgi:tetratricopeptide (TPR) repeat protein